MLKISRESEINLINVLIDNDIISGKDLVNINSYKIIDYIPLGKFVKNEENFLKLIDDDISKVIKV